MTDATGSHPDPPQRQRAPRARQAFRSRHRAASHVSAHADDDPRNHHVPLEHPLVARGPAELILDDAQLARLIQRIRAAGSFAYDSEFIGELSYRPQLCLIQVATTEQIALIDPLAGVRLEPFWELLADESLEKIVHAGEQDIEPVQRLIGKRCANIFDTQICAAFVGLAYPVSLSKLVAQITGARLPKGLTFTHWDQRPLSNMQLRYAADDVRYLPAVRAELGRRLDALGHAGWARQECEALCDPSRYEFDPNHDYLRLRGAGSLSPAQLAVLRALMIWRDQLARESDMPPRAFLRDEILLDMARHPPKAIEKLERVKGLPRPVEREHGQRIVELTLAALQNPVTDAPQALPEPTPAERFRADSLWALVQTVCFSRMVDPNIVASRQEVVELDRLMQSNADVSQHRLMTGWRHDAVGAPLLAIFTGRQHVTFMWENGLQQG